MYISGSHTWDDSLQVDDMSLVGFLHLLYGKKIIMLFTKTFKLMPIVFVK